MINWPIHKIVMNGGNHTGDFLKSLIGDKVNSSFLKPSSNVIKEKHVTLSNGSKITLKPKSKSVKQREKGIIEETSLLPFEKGCVNMHELYEKLRVQEKVKEELKKFADNEKELETVSNQLNAMSNKNKKPVNTLWTEKYRPRKFIELVGNEKVNASILKWLNEWNYTVKVGKLINNNFYDKDSLYNDPLKRPKKKVLLIHGPPGIGKTTIAQCVCRQLGYEIQEINSSDERSGQSVRDRIRNVIRMRSLSGKDVCLLLDEIDGAIGSENGFVKNLIYMLNKDGRATDEWNSFGKLKYNKKEDFIRRPIIAMCNDIGANCLEQLKPYCEIISFRKSTKNSIKKRLKMILEKENINNIKESLLDDLIISLDGDIRNCINFLQFNSQSLNGKVKDMEIIWFQMIKEIFNLDNVNNRKDNRSKSEVFNNLMDKLTNANSDLNRINMGCFNLMLQINDQYDSNNSLSKIDELSEWLYFEDLIGTKNMMMDKDEVSGYNSVLALKYFNLFSNFNEGINSFDKRSNYSFKSNEKFEKKKQTAELVNKLITKYEFSLTKSTLVNMEISMLNYILIPKNLSVKDFERDKGKIARALEIMKALGIEIEVSSIKNNSRIRSGYITYNKMNPDIVQGLVDMRCEYSDSQGRDDDDENDNISNLNEIKAIPYINAILEVYKISQKMKIDKELQKRKLLDDANNDNRVLMNEDNVDKNKPLSTVDFFKKQYTSFHSQLHQKIDGGNTKHEGENNPLKGAFNVNKSARELDEDGAKGGVMSDNANRIWVKYHEGFSNAVRKELTWHSLFAQPN